jgi:hypothetical protein
MVNSKDKAKSNKADWKEGSKTSMKAIQEAFQLSGDIPDVIREEAYREGLSASDMCRKILQLAIEEKKTGGRRLTISLKPGDYEELAQRWGLPADARHAIRSRIRQDLESFYYQHENEKQD